MTISRFDDLVDAFDTPFENLTNAYKTPLASFRIAIDDGDVFSNTSSNDVILMGLSENQTIHISPFTDKAQSLLSITPSNVHIDAPSGLQLKGEFIAHDPVVLQDKLTVHELATFNEVSLDGMLHTDGLATTSGFVFLNDTQEEAVLFLHNDGAFVGGKLHINKDFAQHTVDIEGDLACSGPTYLHNNLFVGSNLEVKNGNIINQPNGFILKNKKLEIPQLEAKENIISEGFIKAKKDIVAYAGLYMPEQNVTISNQTIMADQINILKDSDFHQNVNILRDLRVGESIFINNSFVADKQGIKTQVIQAKSANIEDDLSIGKNLTIFGDLSLPNKSFYTKDLHVHMISLKTQWADFSRSVHIHENLTVDNTTQLKKILGDQIILSSYKRFSDKALDVDGDFELSGKAYIQKSLNVQDDIKCHGSFTLSNNAVIEGSMSVVDDKIRMSKNGVQIFVDMDIHGDTNIKGNTTIEGDIDVDGDIDVKGDLKVKEIDILHGGSLGGNLLVKKRLYVKEDALLESNLEVLEKLTVQKDTDIIGNLHVDKNIYSDGTLSIQKDVNIGGDLISDHYSFIGSNMTANTVHLSNLEVTKELVVHDKMVVHGDLTFGNSTVGIFESSVVANNLTSQSDTFVGGSLHVKDDIIVEEGNVHIMGGEFEANIKAQTLQSDTGFLFVKDQEGEGEDKTAVLYIHNDGLFVGGKLHVNVDFPKYTADIGGSMRCSGPTVFNDTLQVDNTSLFQENVECKKDIIVHKNILTSSDIRLKYDINKVENCLSRIKDLNAYTFKMQEDMEEKTILGLIAQEVEKTVPEVVSKNDTSGYLSVAYGNLVSLLIGAVNEIHDTYEKNKIQWENQISEIHDRLKKLETNKIKSPFTDSILH